MKIATKASPNNSAPYVHRMGDALEQNGIHFARPQVLVAALGGAAPLLSCRTLQASWRPPAALNLAPALGGK
jgi:hypothetical protein